MRAKLILCYFCQFDPLRDKASRLTAKPLVPLWDHFSFITKPWCGCLPMCPGSQTLISSCFFCKSFHGCICHEASVGFPGEKQEARGGVEGVCCSRHLLSPTHSSEAWPRLPGWAGQGLRGLAVTPHPLMCASHSSQLIYKCNNTTVDVTGFLSGLSNCISQALDAYAVLSIRRERNGLWRFSVVTLVPFAILMGS